MDYRDADITANFYNCTSNVVIEPNEWTRLVIDPTDTLNTDVDRIRYKIPDKFEYITPCTIWVDDPRMIVAKAGDPSGKYRGRFSWADVEYEGGRESDMSPESYAVNVSGEILNINSNSQTPEDTTNVTKMRVYIFKEGTTTEYHRVHEQDDTTSTIELDFDDDDLRLGEVNKNIYGVPPAARLGAVVGERIFWSGQPGVYTGTATFAAAAETITRSAGLVTGIALLPRFLEGMTIRAAGDRQSYTILETDNANKARIASERDRFDRPTSEGLYKGGAGEKNFRIEGRKNRVWYTTWTAKEGGLSESVADTNFKDVWPNSGEEIQALGVFSDNGNEALCVCGKSRTALITVNPG